MSWDAGLQRVSVRHGSTPKPVTLVLPYYGNPKFLGDQLRWWRELPADLRAHLRLIITDDGTPWSLGPAASVLVGAELPFPTRLFRISVDVPWNWLAARNIGAHHAEDGWLLLTDIDHVARQATLERLVYGEHLPEVVYGLSRIEHDGRPVHPHSASFFLTRDRFWQIGGYDERYSGYYGSDGCFRKRLRANAPLVILDDVRLERHEKRGDSGTTTYQRKLQADNEAIARITADIEASGEPPRVLSFPYEEVTL
jgi:hypothetical protein